MFGIHIAKCSHLYCEQCKVKLKIENELCTICNRLEKIKNPFDLQVFLNSLIECFKVFRTGRDIVKLVLSVN